MASSSQPTCIVCRNYSDIDTFAADFQLKMLWGMMSVDPMPNFLSKKQATENQDKIAEYIKNIDELQENSVRQDQELQAISKRLGEIDSSLKELDKDGGKSAAGPSSSDKRETLTAEQANLKQREADIKQLNAMKELLDKQGNLEKEGQQTIEAIGKSLWKRCISGGVAKADDNVARARLFCSWIANSFRFNESRATRHGMRKPMEGFVWGEEVCEGYSATFVALFNATNPPVTAPGTVATLAKTIIQKVRNVNSGETGHVWVAFPLEPFRPADAPDNIKSGYKIIDPLWFQTTLSSTWFTRSNQSFQRSHLSSSPGGTGLSNSQPIVDTASFWSRQLATIVYGADVDFNVDPSSLVPTQLKLSAASNSKVDFSFRKACPHWPDNIAYYVVVAAAKVLEDTAIRFRLDADGMTWRATLDIKSVPASHQVQLVAPLVDNKPYAGDLKQIPKGKKLDDWGLIACWDVESKDAVSKFGYLNRVWGEPIRDLLRR